MAYKLPLTAKVRKDLLKKFEDHHLRPAPADISDENLVKAVEQIETKQTPDPNAGDQKGQNPDPIQNAGTGDIQANPDPNQNPQTDEKLEAERKRYFAFFGQSAPESASSEILKELNDQKEDAIANSKKIEDQKVSEPSIKYDTNNEYLIKKGEDVRVVNKVTWDNYLSKNPDGWEKFVSKPKE